jgi:Mannosyl-glycoprotein endo-beta-N-acetylglucosaminidase
VRSFFAFRFSTVLTPEKLCQRTYLNRLKKYKIFCTKNLHKKYKLFYLCPTDFGPPYINKSAMGKTKQEFESGKQQPFRSGAAAPIRHTGGGAAQGKRHNYAPGRFRADPADTLPMRVLLRQLWLRVRRWWMSLSFQFHRHTRGIFKNARVVQLTLLVAIGYIIHVQDGFGLFTDADREDSPRVIGQSVETTLGLGSHAGSSRLSGASKRNGAAPVGAKELHEEQAREYIERFGNIAREEMQKYGIPASISLAQGLVESRAGTSRLAVRNNNHFGMKCFSKKCPKGHCSNFTDDHHKDFFRIYPSPWESWRAHSQMLSNGRYASLKKHGRDYRKWAHGLKGIGYATDRNYAEKLIGMIEKFDLHRYDQ